MLLLTVLVVQAPCLGEEEEAPLEPESIEPAQPTETATNTLVMPEEIRAAARAVQQVQEQLQIINQNLDRNRQEAEAAAVRSSEAVANRLQNIEQSLSNQRSREIESLESATRWMLGGAGVFALLSCITVIAMAWFQWRTVGKLADITSSIPRGLGPSEGLPALGAGVSVSAPVEQANLRFLGSLDRLEKRILELEAFTRPVLEQHSPGNGTVPGVPRNGQADAGDGASSEETSRASSLVGKGNSLLSLDKYEDALACFNEALSLEPDYPEALLKKGIALEKLGKLEDALALYDRAISGDASLTVAYLHKGGIYNRLERFTEALECYEKALQKSEPAQA